MRLAAQPVLWIATLTVAGFALAGPATAQTGSLQQGEFRARLWMWDENRDDWARAKIAWNTNENVAFYVFSRDNPEAVVKLLDGRPFNGHWWADFATMSDLRLHLMVWNDRTDEIWRVDSGRAKDLFSDRPADRRRIVCAWPQYNKSERRGDWCVWGTGTSSREAWDHNGRIPEKFWEDAVVGFLE